MLKEYDLRHSKKSKITGVIISGAFILLGVLTMLGILDFKFLLEAWKDSVLYKYVPSKSSAIIYVLIGAFFMIVTFIPNKYSKVEVLTDKIRFYKGEKIADEWYYEAIGNIHVEQKNSSEPKHLIIDFKDKNLKKKDISLNYKSDIGEFIEETFKNNKKK